MQGSNCMAWLLIKEWDDDIAAETWLRRPLSTAEVNRLLRWFLAKTDTTTCGWPGLLARIAKASAAHDNADEFLTVSKQDLIESTEAAAAGAAAPSPYLEHLTYEYILEGRAN